MGDIHRTLTLDVHIAGDKEGICLGNHRPGRIIQLAVMLRASRCRIFQRHRSKPAQLNVLRAITVGLLHRHAKAARRCSTDTTDDTVAAPGVKFDPQQTDRSAVSQLRRIIGSRQAAELQQPWFR